MLAFLEPCFSHSFNLSCRLFVKAGDDWPTDADISHNSFSAAYLHFDSRPRSNSLLRKEIYIPINSGPQVKLLKFEDYYFLLA